MPSKVSQILVIAGSDPSSGAGIQADIKTANSLKTFSAAVITSLTAQNSQKVFDIFNPPVNFLKAQLEAVLNDLDFDCIKIGMVQNSEIIKTIADILSEKAAKKPIFLDTIITSTTGANLLEKNAIEVLKSELISKSYLVTPNILEAEILSGVQIKNLEDIKKAALIIKKLGCKNVLIKGGHFISKSEKITNVLLDEQNKFHLVTNKKLNLTNEVRGTGCRLLTAISCNFSKEKNLLQAVKKSNNYVFRLLRDSEKLGTKNKIIAN